MILLRNLLVSFVIDLLTQESADNNSDLPTTPSKAHKHHKKMTRIHDTTKALTNTRLIDTYIHIPMYTLLMLSSYFDIVTTKL